jgi:hypothetical protein
MRITSSRSIPTSFDSSSGVRWLGMGLLSVEPWSAKKPAALVALRAQSFRSNP